MLPVPSVDYFLPLYYKNDPDPAVAAFTAKLDEIFNGIKSDMVSELRLHDITHMPSQFLPVAAAWLNATFVTGDSDQTKRKKIANAVPARNQAGLWTPSVKPELDAVTGASAVLYSDVTDDWWVWEEGNEATVTATAWDTFGEGDDAALPGMILAEADVESINPANVYIDLGTATLTADQVTEIVALMQQFTPAYFRVYLGYTTAGSFTEYAGGTVN